LTGGATPLLFPVMKFVQTVVSEYADKEGNFRATSTSHPGFVGYGKTAKEAGENLTKTVNKGERANPLALFEASFMTLSAADQVRFIEKQHTLRRS
jgi:hypothetical protein